MFYIDKNLQEKLQFLILCQVAHGSQLRIKVFLHTSLFTGKASHHIHSIPSQYSRNLALSGDRQNHPLTSPNSILGFEKLPNSKAAKEVTLCALPYRSLSIADVVLSKCSCFPSAVESPWPNARWGSYQ